MSGMSKAKHAAFEWLDRQAERFSQWHLKIWEYAEPAWR